MVVTLLCARTRLLHRALAHSDAARDGIAETKERDVCNIPVTRLANNIALRDARAARETTKDPSLAATFKLCALTWERPNEDSVLNVNCSGPSPSDAKWLDPSYFLRNLIRLEAESAVANKYDSKAHVGNVAIVLFTWPYRRPPA
jgi:hypothetical protein